MPTACHWGVKPEKPTPKKFLLRAGTATTRAGSLRPVGAGQEGGPPPIPEDNADSMSYETTDRTGVAPEEIPPPPPSHEGSPPTASDRHELDDGLEPRRDDPREFCRRLGAAMLRRNRSLRAQYDVMMELRNIDARRENVQREEYIRFTRRQSRRPRRNDGEESPDESYTPTPDGLEDEGSSSEEGDRLASFEWENWYLRTRSTAFTRRLNARLEGIREQEGVIEAIYRDAYRPTERARLAPGEPRVGDMTPRNSRDNVSQVEYVGPPRSGGLTMSFVEVEDRTSTNHTQLLKTRNCPERTPTNHNLSSEKSPTDLKTNLS